MKNPSDQETFLGLKSRDNHAYEILYKFYYPSVKYFIVKNNGTQDDAKDIFQETIMVLLHKVPKDDFNLTSSLKTYIFAISSNLWLKRLRDSNKIVKSDPDIYEKYLADYEEGETNNPDNKTVKAQNILKKITDKCVTLLKAIFYDKKDIDIITKEFGYTNKHNAQNQKYKCLEQARRSGDQFL
jgi:RNA polymerase sigma factor (sigma-70 family)